MTAIKYARRKRSYISIYFQNGNIGGRKKRDITISFQENEILYKKCNKLTSMRIREILGVSSYGELTERAKEESRSLGNYVKAKLSRYFKDNE